MRQADQHAVKQPLSLTIDTPSAGALSGTVSAQAIGEDNFTGTVDGRQFTLNFSGADTGTLIGRVRRRGAVLVGALTDQTSGSTGRFRLKLNKPAQHGAFVCRNASGVLPVTDRQFHRRGDRRHPRP